MKSRSWDITIENKQYNIVYTSSFYKKKLLVNNIPIKLQTSKTFGVTAETTFNIGNKTVILVIIDNDADISIDGYYLESGEKYINVENMPKWNYIFLGLVLLIFVISNTSICSGLFTFLGLYFLVRASIEPSLSIKKRIILCLVITISMHLFFWFVLYLLLSIL